MYSSVFCLMSRLPKFQVGNACVNRTIFLARAWDVCGFPNGPRGMPRARPINDTPYVTEEPRKSGSSPRQAGDDANSPPYINNTSLPTKTSPDNMSSQDYYNQQQGFGYSNGGQQIYDPQAPYYAQAQNPPSQQHHSPPNQPHHQGPPQHQPYGGGGYQHDSNPHYPPSAPQHHQGAPYSQLSQHGGQSQGQHYPQQHQQPPHQDQSHGGSHDQHGQPKQAPLNSLLGAAAGALLGHSATGGGGGGALGAAVGVLGSALGGSKLEHALVGE
ncbi:uncharacterized protein B0T15DRAFT_515196 [Chaetomium strumarium]|uniref:Glycine zipper 2TM domain-containing protein n=1 Tax=Chaetomium strumarium TaxID=1170767 RepID=A0AAJ0H0K7_9PEZI|nr:hypothetical protein B0T15DRAFT_515196 [Chaetomium strumarium]